MNFILVKIYSITELFFYIIILLKRLFLKNFLMVFKIFNINIIFGSVVKSVLLKNGNFLNKRKLNIFINKLGNHLINVKKKKKTIYF